VEGGNGGKAVGERKTEKTERRKSDSRIIRGGEKVKRQERREEEDEGVPAESRRSNTESKSNSAERS